MGNYKVIEEMLKRKVISLILFRFILDGRARSRDWLDLW